MPYDICLFDLDGTLTDPMLGITGSFRHALSVFGINLATEELIKFIGPPLRETFMAHLGFTAPDTEKAVAVYREYFENTGIYENTIYPETLGLLQKLAGSGKKLAIATSKVTRYTVRILEHFGIGGYFAYVSGDEMDGSRTKNGKREIISIALDTLYPGREAAAVMVGDRMHDIKGAFENGIDSIGVLWGYGTCAELKGAGATYIAKTPQDLLRLL